MTDTRLKALAAKLKTLLDDKIMPEAERYYSLKTDNQLTSAEKNRGQAVNLTAFILKGVLLTLTAIQEGKSDKEIIALFASLSGQMAAAFDEKSASEADIGTTERKSST